MSAEIGAKNGYIPPDDKVAEWLGCVGAKPCFAQKTQGRPDFSPAETSQGDTGLGAEAPSYIPEKGKEADSNSQQGEAWLRPYEEWHTDPDAEIARAVQIDIANLAPQIARPHRVDNVADVSAVAGTRVHQCLLGTCTNGRLEDLMAAWEVLKGRQVHPGTRLLVFPASQRVNRQAVKAGLMEQFIDAGAVWMNPGCGPCLGAHEGALAPEEACISTANRNFKGRMGTPESEIYLASPQSVAAAAITGEITDPREV
ncbi:hypothetical protein JW859_09995 [bacterium]|nr:hypothetical protein [bacterium]